MQSAKASCLLQKGGWRFAAQRLRWPASWAKGSVLKLRSSVCRFEETVRCLLPSFLTHKVKLWANLLSLDHYQCIKSETHIILPRLIR